MASPLLPLCACLLALGCCGDPCYSRSGLARRCQPPLVEAALGLRVRASSICGRPPAEFCDPEGTSCRLCDARDPLRNHPPSYLTDPHDPRRPTCWQSAGAGRGGGVTLTLPLGRPYELARLSLRFCGARPESMALYKSGDGGRSWAPLRFYSARCRHVYGRPAGRGREGPLLCTGAQSRRQPARGSLVEYRLPKSPASPLAQDRATATHLRAVFSHPQPPRTLAGPSPGRHHRFYAVSDFRVRARCQCNGHASRCPAPPGDADRVPGAPPRLCDCRHHTEGIECQTCQLFFRDRPWGRATPTDAHECAVCDCNRHSSRCRFNQELYEASGRRSGGVCLRCRHNTDGRHCHHCTVGYTRDLTKPLTHRKACKPCQCHRVGALSPVCDRTTGQCQCKTSVSGVQCQRCASGYQQSQLVLFPCTRIPEVTSMTPLNSTSSMTGTGCESHCTPSSGSFRMDLKEYCRKDYVMQIRVASSEKVGDWWKFNVTVGAIFKRPARPVGRGRRPLWVPSRDLDCGCPRLRAGGAYLLLGGPAGAPGERQRRLVAGRSGTALPWRAEWARRLRGLQRGQRRGGCEETGAAPTPTPSPSPEDRIAQQEQDKQATTTQPDQAVAQLHLNISLASRTP